MLEIEAIHCRPDNPYIFTSGRSSPVYIDCRKIISFPEARAWIMSHALKAVEKQIGWSKIDAVAGGETAGIPFAAFLAALAKKPMVYVRKQPKGFGRMAQIEVFFSSRRRHTISLCDWSSDVCSSDLRRSRQIAQVQPRRVHLHFASGCRRGEDGHGAAGPGRSGGFDGGANEIIGRGKVDYFSL